MVPRKLSSSPFFHFKKIFVAMGVIVTLGVFSGLVLVEAGWRKTWTTPVLVREIAAPDHVWFVDPVTGERRFIATSEEAKPIALIVARNALERIISSFDPLGFLVRHSTELQRPDLQKIPTANTASWLEVGEGYVADIIAGDLERPRVLGFDPAGRLVVSQLIEKGKLVAFESDGHGGFVSHVIVDAEEEGRGHLFNAHGFVFAGGRLIVASEDRIESWAYDAKAGHVRGKPTKIADLPYGSDKFAGGGHKTRTLVLGRDGKLYVSIGSSCNGCLTDGTNRAVVKRMNLDGSNVEIVATGLRNTVFFTEDVGRGLWYGNDMGRDDLGEELPPDELNILHMGGDYGWPLCYGDRLPIPAVADQRGVCDKTMSPVFGYPAHAAPLGLRIIPKSFNAEWAGDLLVAFHGSTIRTHSVAGYSIARVKLDEAGNPLGMEEVIGGWLRGENVPVGRPVDMVFSSDGTLYISDDHAGVIHRVRRVE